MIFVLAAFLWLPASAHCQLETISGLEFLRCAVFDQSSHDPCTDAGCCSVEKSQYKVEQNHFNLSVPAVPVNLLPVQVVFEKSLPAETTCGILTAAPPQLVKAWNFISRTALPVRAPSILS